MRKSNSAHLRHSIENLEENRSLNAEMVAIDSGRAAGCCRLFAAATSLVSTETSAASSAKVTEANGRQNNNAEIDGNVLFIEKPFNVGF